jgi:hypothetical protein
MCLAAQENVVYAIYPLHTYSTISLIGLPVLRYKSLCVKSLREFFERCKVLAKSPG